MSVQLEKHPQDPMLDVALGYISKGWPVFPCRSADEVTDEYDPDTGEITVYKAKTPLISNGFKGATLSDRIATALWGRHPGAVVGMPTGERSGVLVLDIDVKSGVNGYEWVEAMESLHGDMPVTATASTPSGGRHYYFKYIPGTGNRMDNAIGVDLRSEGGFVIAPGSVMATGKSYQWIDYDGDGIPPIADAPSWLVELIVKKKPEPVHANNNYDYTSRMSNSAYVDRAIDDEIRTLAGTPMGSRNIELNKSSFCLGTFVGAGAISESEASALLRGVADSWGRDIHISYQTIKNGLEAGALQPRHIPEPTTHHDDNTTNTSLDAMTAMVERGIAKAKAKIEQETRAHEEPDAGSHHDESPATTPKSTTEEKGILDTSPIIATPFSYIDPKTLPLREFAFGKHYIRKYVSVTSSPGGLGKTSNSIAEALMMATGKNYLEPDHNKKLRVWVFNAEDPRDEMERRIMAACLHYDLSPTDIEGQIFLDTGREQELVIAVDNKKGVVIQEPVVEAVVREIKRHKIDVMIIDPFVSTHSVNENDNGAIDKVAKMWAKIADHTNIAIDVVHHLRKAREGVESTVEDSRGAVSLLAAARSARILNQMTEAQSDDAGISKDDRFGYFSISYGKSNLSKRDGKLTWRRLVSQDLGNGRKGRGSFPTLSDSAAVVTAWHWPTAGDIVEKGITEDQLRLLKGTLDGSQYKEGNRAAKSAASAVAYAMGLDVDDEKHKRKSQSILRALLAEGVLSKVEEHDAVNRKMAVYVKSREYVERLSDDD